MKRSAWTTPKPESIIRMAQSLGIPTAGRNVKDVYKDVNHRLLALLYKK